MNIQHLRNHQCFPVFILRGPGPPPIFCLFNMFLWGQIISLMSQIICTVPLFLGLPSLYACPRIDNPCDPPLCGSMCFSMHGQILKCFVCVCVCRREWKWEHLWKRKEEEEEEKSQSAFPPHLLCTVWNRQETLMCMKKSLGRKKERKGKKKKKNDSGPCLLSWIL